MKKIKITNHNIPSRHSTLYTYYRLTSISNLQNSFREVKKRGNSMFTLSTQTLTINKINVYVIRHKFFLKKKFFFGIFNYMLLFSEFTNAEKPVPLAEPNEKRT